MQEINISRVTPNELVELINIGIKGQLQEFTAFVQSKPIDNNKPHFTRKETAEFFDVSLNCINDWCKNGILKPKKVGQRVYFSKEECINTLFNTKKGLNHGK